MITTLDQKDILFTVLDESALKEEITGDICKGERPLNSNNEDITIRPLPINNDQLQVGVVSVNIHVPDIKVTKDGKTWYSEDHLRLKELADIAKVVLNDVASDPWYFTIQQMNVLKDEEFNEHFLNIRLEFYSINL